MHNCKKRVVQCLNVSFITVPRFLTDVLQCSSTKVWHPQNDILNGIDLKIHASSLAHRSACGYSITDFSHDFSNQKYAS